MFLHINKNAVYEQIYNQNISSPLPKSSPHGHNNQNMQQPLSSPSPNLVQNLDRNGTDTNSVFSNMNPNVEPSDDNVNEVIGKLLLTIIELLWKINIVLSFNLNVSLKLGIPYFVLYLHLQEHMPMNGLVQTSRWQNSQQPNGQGKPGFVYSL